MGLEFDLARKRLTLTYRKDQQKRVKLFPSPILRLFSATTYDDIGASRSRSFLPISGPSRPQVKFDFGHRDIVVLAISSEYIVVALIDGGNSIQRVSLVVSADAENVILDRVETATNVSDSTPRTANQP